ncbi:hypothetical protein NEF87_000330 [Candidatus Lokiarchaeum ossiferum]|uniref:Uncharacterized protein n=1 Tax=Candidatus Lokiarchaeum ossiferum TaxID=2951803 RepID=A0ABY6HKW9_9ARCH|nr:hypothetical protein NEF87_000330 [Candidatus Lokiarchaeum sp. B-35]
MVIKRGLTQFIILKMLVYDYIKKELCLDNLKKLNLKYFSIMNAAGINMLTIINDKVSNPVLLSGFLSAIFSFGAESLNEKMARFTLEGDDDRLESYVEDDNQSYSDRLVVVGLLKNSVEKNKFQKFAKQILSEFRDQFNTEIINWDGNLNSFNLFSLYVSKQIREKFESNIREENDFVEITALDEKLDDMFSRAVEGDLSALSNLDTFMDSYY